MFRVAVLGSNGVMGRRHCEAYEALGHVIVRVAGLGLNAPDIVSIASPDQCHAKQVIAALEAGAHVFCEKPVSHVPFDLWRVRRLVRKGRSKFAVNLPLAHTEKFMKAIAAVLRGDLGQIYSIEAAYNWGRRWKLAEGWRKSCKPYSYMAAGGLHLMDVADRMLGANRDWTELAEVSDDKVQTRHWKVGQAKVTVRANFGYNGHHEHWMRVWGSTRMLEVINMKEAADHLGMILDFCEAVKHDQPTNGLRALYLNRMAL